MHISCAFPSVIAGSRRKLVFVDIGNNYNSDDFEAYVTGAINLGTVSSLKATDFELFATGQAVGFTRDIYNRSSYDFEQLTSGDTLYSIPRLKSEGFEAHSLNLSGICSAIFPYAVHNFESFATGSAVLTPFMHPNGFPQPSGAQTQIFP